MSQTPQTYSKFGQTFISYGSYHHNLINKIIHIICIPIITATFFAMISYLPVHFNVAGHDVGAFHIAVALVLLYYLRISVSAFLIMSVAIGLSTFAWLKLFGQLKGDDMLKTIVILNVFGWGFQFIGHGFFEKRKPALLDNIWQIFSAPLFVVIELLDLVGVRTKEIEQWKVQIQNNVKQLQQKNQKNK